ncbi:gluconate 2-dehydrogenase subunit 3 family protein [Amphritea sp. 1_MG-2023]|uniref:gluconate 2-dehydrogenase subunit 3 family protein n=1 Tax=Amphritea sp. 1_MG-2023 TaxID=3062670 RepID=UPI0026E3F1CE|nr:gluconate 2-dehydrogenase subunit 3 family protein [Amphritea sp. 1_MG-2023]MDO6562181.1 gluconate 2-dehydrogenase subunit 3 family protein [Amphritea sp. 1_MG-2023]
MKPLSRRQLLIATLYSVILPTPPVLLAATVRHKTEHTFAATLGAFVDMILPADAFSPAATQLGIDQSLWQLADSDANLNKLLIRGCGWLNREAFGNFVTLPDSHKLELLQWMDQSASPRRLPGLFFMHVRYHAVSFYYASEHIHQTLGLTPPQPIGYPEIGQRKR